MIDIIRIDLGGVNSYLVKAEQGYVLIDTGGPMVMDKQFVNRCAALQERLDAAGCTNGKLNLIVLTHGDIDHVCNAAYLKAHYDAPVALHGDDRKIVEMPTLEDWMESFRYRSLAYRLVFRLLKNTIRNVIQKSLDDFTPFTPDVLLSDGFDLSPYGLEATVIHTPGHTKGSIAVLTKQGDLLAGDTFSNIKKPEAVANASDFTQLSVSMMRLKGFSINTVYPGHGDPFAFDKNILVLSKVDLV